MAFEMPESMDELVYFTNRKFDNGKVTCWVYRNDCPKCGKAKMGKPKDEKTGKPKIRAKEYVCEACGNTIEKKEYEETLNAQAIYDCPHCQNHGEIEIPFKRKKFMGVDALVFTAGIGVGAWFLRELITEHLGNLGVKLDQRKNKNCETELIISKKRSKIKIIVIPTNEEMMIARQTKQVLKLK